MKRPSRWLAIRYHSRAIYRALLALWYGLISDIEDWWPGFVKRHIVDEQPPIRVAVYPRRGDITPDGQIPEWRVVLLKNEQGKEIATLAEGVDQYLHFLESYLPPFALHRHT